MRFFLLVCFGIVSLRSASAQLASLTTPRPEPEITQGSAPEILTFAEQMPGFPGGTKALNHFLVTKINYTDTAVQRGLSGKVIVQFVVDEQGRLLDPTVVKTTNAEFNAEAIRLIYLMPWWTPGRHQGQSVRVRCTLPIMFSFER